MHVYQFQSTHPARGATPAASAWPRRSGYFNPRTPRGVRRGKASTALMESYFNPRTPRGVRRVQPYLRPYCIPFQSTHPARGATSIAASLQAMGIISIHAPREGCDGGAALDVRASSTISIHAPREGCDFAVATHNIAIRHISIHAPREGCDLTSVTWPRDIVAISIHAPREGCDTINFRVNVDTLDFNPRTPRGVRPDHETMLNKGLNNFNPRTPRGVRRERGAPWGPSFYFNPRTPRGVRQQTLPKSREFAWLNLLICTRGRRLSIQKQTRLCSIKLSFMLFGCEPAGEGVSSWTSHATKSKVRLEGRSA